MTARTSVAFALSGVGFLSFVLLRPWGDKTGDPARAAAAFADPAWVLAHSLGMAAWVAFAAALVLTGGARTAGLAGLGVAALLPFYGAEAFGVHALATTVSDPRVVGSGVEALRGDPIASTAFGVGLLLTAVAAMLAARAAGGGRGQRAVRWIAAAGIATYLPQFFAPPGVRIAHGVVLGLALIALALIAVAARRPRGRAGAAAA